MRNVCADWNADYGLLTVRPRMEGDRFVSRPVTVLVLTPSIGGFYFGELLAGLGREVSGSGGRLVLVQTLDHGTRNNEASEPSDFATRVAWAEADGVVSITSAAGGPYLQQFRDAGKPVVLVSTRLLDFEAPVALPDNHGGTFAAVEHLIEHGHTRIGFVGNLGQADVRDRRAAYLDALAAHGIPADPGLLFPAPNNDWAGGVQAGHDVMASRSACFGARKWFSPRMSCLPRQLSGEPRAAAVPTRSAPRAVDTSNRMTRRSRSARSRRRSADCCSPATARPTTPCATRCTRWSSRSDG